VEIGPKFEGKNCPKASGAKRIVIKLIPGVAVREGGAVAEDGRFDAAGRLVLGARTGVDFTKPFRPKFTI
jgi:hypothetical protein